MFSLEFFDSSSEDESEFIKNENSVRRDLRESYSPLNLNDSAFKKRFRINKFVFNYILNELKLDKGKRITKINPTQMMAVTLEIMAKGSYQDVIGNDYVIDMGQSTVSKVFWTVINKMEEILCPNWIEFKNVEETTLHFWDKFKLPGIIGCIDGTHVYLLKPSENEHAFYNRKGQHSINVMIICDHQLKILAVSPKYGGRAHDSFVWSLSSERSFLENRFLNGEKNLRLLGDSGYPLEPWLLTPYRASDDTTKNKLNAVHSSARSTVERCIGVLKGRWRILLEERKTRYEPKKVAQIINVCCALHNICVHHNIEFNEELPNLDHIHVVNSDQSSNYKRIAKDIRDRIKNSL